MKKPDRVRSHLRRAIKVIESMPVPDFTLPQQTDTIARLHSRIESLEIENKRVRLALLDLMRRCDKQGGIDTVGAHRALGDFAGYKKD